MAAENSIAELRRVQKSFIHALIAPLTERGYRYDWAAFARWCRTMRLESLPATADTLALYCTARLSQNCKTSTVRRNISAVLAHHRACGHTPPPISGVCELLRGARRMRSERLRQVRPLTLENVHAIVACNELSLRNRALVLVGFASSLRCANLAGLLLEDVEFTPQGVILRVGREKQDQESVGRLIGIPYGKHCVTCPVRMLKRWIHQRGPWAGPLFCRLDRHDRAAPLQPERIGQIVQLCCRKIGLPWQQYGGHSLRAGFVTAAGEAGAADLLIAAQTGHHDLAVLRTYFRRRDVFRANACGLLGL